MTPNISAISPVSTLIEAMSAIDKSGKGFVLIVSSDGRLDGVLTDGDIRRQLLAGLKRNDKITDIYNRNPITLKQPYSFNDVRDIFKTKKIRHLPVTDDNGVLLDVLFDVDYLSGQTVLHNPVVIMAGGIGSRLMPLTKNCPKPMVPVAGIPMIERIIGNLKSSGFYRMFLTVNYKKDVLKDYFKDGSDFGVEITYIEETKRMGTAGSLKLAEFALDQDILVTNGDILCGANFAQILSQHKASRALATMAVRDYSAKVPFGVVSVRDKEILSITEKPSFTHLVSAGINVLNPQAIRFIPDDVFYDMPSLFQALLEAGKKTNVYHINEYWFDLGTKKDLDVAAAFLESQDT